MKMFGNSDNGKIPCRFKMFVDTMHMNQRSQCGRKPSTKQGFSPGVLSQGFSASNKTLQLSELTGGTQMTPFLVNHAASHPFVSALNARRNSGVHLDPGSASRPLHGFINFLSASSLLVRGSLTTEECTEHDPKSP